MNYQLFSKTKTLGHIQLTTEIVYHESVKILTTREIMPAVFVNTLHVADTKPHAAAICRYLDITSLALGIMLDNGYFQEDFSDE